jgi:hypothetical protein
MLDDVKIPKDEYREFLGWKLNSLMEKRKDIQHAISEIEERLANDFSLPTKEDSGATSGESNTPVKNTRNSIGWKYRIREVLSIEDGRLTSAEVVNKLCESDTTINREVAIKSAGSALSTNSRNSDSMFIKEAVNGVFYYRNNPLYKE